MEASTAAQKLVKEWLTKPKPNHFKTERLSQWIAAVRGPKSDRLLTQEQLGELLGCSGR